ncbi:hypothetical protein Moror_1614 [Moniliophthora roreri MCA 2997]|uniref:Uncharacterized protein n=2 Tax=Moniliophthora roreri TaxID=221103 RepID=V2X3B1_MONRO|nr:hypothetical protein Moror_1614 [Moniliophthora roreri MCA 2997]KAI3610987.1 hypothetical protein WG66_013781 [Moniliophthora roreri]
MPLFSRRTHRTTRTTRSHRGGGLFHRKDRDRVAGGYKAALSNPNTTREGRKHAKHKLRSMGQSTHVPFMTKVKRTLGIRSGPRHSRTTKRTRF